MSVSGDPNRDYGAEWLEWRKGKGWSQKEMARAAGVTDRTIRNVERGHLRPNSTTRELVKELMKRHREAESWQPQQ